MKKAVAEKRAVVILPKEYRDIPSFILSLFEQSVLENDSAIICDLVAMLAWRANVKRKRISRKLTRSPAGRFLHSIDEALLVWEKENQILSRELKVHLFTTLFYEVADRSHSAMKKMLMEGLRKSPL